MYYYVKAVHIIFMVTWFAGLFYMPRLMIYVAEAQAKENDEKKILTRHLLLMSKRLWLGISWPSAILTLLLGGWMWWLFGSTPPWLLTKLFFVVGLYAYHISLHLLYKQQAAGIFRFTGHQLRIWNEVATIFLIAIVMLVVVKSRLSAVWGLGGLALLIVILLVAIRVYKRIRSKKEAA